MYVRNKQEIELVFAIVHAAAFQDMKFYFHSNLRLDSSLEIVIFKSRFLFFKINIILPFQRNFCGFPHDRFRLG